MAISPTQLSLKHLKTNGWDVCIVEKWIAQAKKRIDAFGFGDLLGYHPEYVGATLFQVTTYDNTSARKKKILENICAKGWIKAGNGVIIHGWKKNKNKKWEVKEIVLKIEDFVDDQKKI